MTETGTTTTQHDIEAMCRELVARCNRVITIQRTIDRMTGDEAEEQGRIANLKLKIERARMEHGR